MKIVVLNGSPKGDISVTMQYIHYLQKKFTKHQFEIINIAKKIKQIEEDEDIFQGIVNKIKSSDGVIWAFPLYVFTVHANYHRFIELIFERTIQDIFKNKYTCLIATSIHFFDHTALNYMNAICDDLEMKYVDSISPHMNDLEKKDFRKNLYQFANNFFDEIENNTTTIKNFNTIKPTSLAYTPGNEFRKIDTQNKKIVVVTDSFDNNTLKNMVHTFKKSFTQSIELINLQELKINGSCLGCIKCGYDYQCIYSTKDDYINFYNKKLKTADIIIFAGTLKYRYLSSSWKVFFDRSFFNTHTPTLTNKQFGFIISGPLNQVPNLRQILESYTQFQKSNLVGFVTDEYNTSVELDKQINALAYNLVKFSCIDYHKPNTFLGVGGFKIFRDDIWGPLRFPFVADHKAYKATNIYDFPHKNYKRRLHNFLFLLLCKIPVVRKSLYSDDLKNHMIQDLQKIVQDETS